MIKLLHFADVHLGMENYGFVDKKTGLNSRLSDFLKCFDKMTDYVLENELDMVLFAGDAFKTRQPSPTYQREFAKRIKRIAANNIPVVLLVGNHDLPAAIGKADTLEIYKILDVENIYVSKEPEILRFVKLEGGPFILDKEDKEENKGSAELNFKNRGLEEGKRIQIATLPWISKSLLATREDYEKMSLEQVREKMSGKLKKTVEGLAAKIDPRYPSVLLAHLTVAGAEFGSEQIAYIGKDIVLPLDALTRSPFNYIALGHLHKHQVLSERPLVIYSGSIDRIDFGEEKEEKGFVVLEIEKGEGEIFKTNYKFIPLPARKFQTINVEISEEETNPQDKVCQEIKKYEIKDKVVRVKIKLPRSLEGSLNEKEIRQALSQAYFIAAIKKETIKDPRALGFESMESLSPLEALEKYLQTKNVKEEKISKLKKFAERLMEEEAD